jgi:aerobic carbon-monoxide dehydrogenase small subunit
MEVQINLKVNGDEHRLYIRPDEMLIDVLRTRLQLTGTKNSCNMGICGSCSVIMDGRLVSACLVPALRADGSEILTIEGLSQDGDLHPIQKAFVEEGAVQCGYCTPGMVMAAKHLLDHNQHPSHNEVKEAISGNLCRCTGYVKIVKAIEKAASEL